nr:transposase [Thalassoroseus pseudoceratinae]
MELSWRIVQRYIHSDQLPDWQPVRERPSQMTNYRERIEAWLADGNDNAAALHRRLLCEGVRLSYTTVRTYVSRLMATRGLFRQRINAAKPPRSRAPSTKALSFAVMTDPTRRTPTQQSQVNCLHKLSPGITEAVDLVETFAALIRKSSCLTWREWQAKAWDSPCSELRGFAEGLERDRNAVQAAFDEPWSSGPVEGHINRLKTIKRQMSGRAGLALLRARMIRAG